MVTTVKQVISMHEVTRRRAGFTQTQLSNRTGVDRSYCSRVEAGLIPASYRYQQRFAGACGVAVEDVFDPKTGRVLAAPHGIGAA